MSIQLLPPALQWLVESLGIIFYPLMSLVRFFLDLNKVSNSANKDIPIVIYEQWFTQNSWHFLLKKYLEKKGFRVYLVNFSLFKGDFYKAAKYLSRYLEQKKLEKVTLVGISLGGVSSLVYLHEYGWDKVYKFIGLGAPFRGTPLAITFSFLPAGRQIRPGSTFIRKLNQFEIDNLDKVICIRANKDEMVPYWSSYWEKAENITINVNGHNNLHIFTREVFDLIAKQSLS